MSMDTILILSVILFGVCAAAALVVSVHTRNQTPAVICGAAGGILLVCAAVLLLKPPGSAQRAQTPEAPSVITYSIARTTTQNARSTRKHAETTGASAQAGTSAEKTPAVVPKANHDRVFITKTGKKYHYSASCGSGEYYVCTLEQAKTRGLTPCKRCAGG